jgi:hypothetical protein
MALAFDFTDMGEQYSLEIRRDVAVFSEGLAEVAVATLQITHDVFVQCLMGVIGCDEAIANGNQVDGRSKQSAGILYLLRPTWG